MSEIQLMPQEAIGNSKFCGQLVVTCGFQESFGEVAPVVAIKTLLKIVAERVRGEGADYIQVAIFQGTKFWIIDDEEVITFLLPSEY